MNSLARGHRGLGLICASVLACLVALPIVTEAAGSDEDLTKADWSVNAPHNLADNPPSKDAVWSFIGRVPGRFSDGGKLCDFRFVDLRHRGTLSLVVSDDAGGISDCSEVEVFDKGAGGIEEYYSDGYLETPGVEDINGGGRLEVVVDEPDGTEYQEADQRHLGSGIAHCDACRACNEVWPRVYAWTGSGYTEVSSQYPKYCERELESLKKQIAGIDASEASPKLPASGATTPLPSVPGFAMGGHWSSETVDGPRTGLNRNQQTLPEPSVAASSIPEAAETPYPGGLDCLQAEAAKIERFLGISKDAGMADAKQWANSNDPAEREFVTSILPEIGTTEALNYEQTLARDSEHDVADSAKAALKDWGNQEPEEPVAFERSP